MESIMSRSSVLPLKIPARSAQRLVKSSRLSWLARDNLSSKYIWNCEELAAFPHELRIHICFAHDNFNTGHDAGGLIMMLYLFPDVIKPFRNDDKEEQILFRNTPFDRLVLHTAYWDDPDGPESLVKRGYVMLCNLRDESPPIIFKCSSGQGRVQLLSHLHAFLVQWCGDNNRHLSEVPSNARHSKVSRSLDPSGSSELAKRAVQSKGRNMKGRTSATLKTQSARLTKLEDISDRVVEPTTDENCNLEASEKPSFSPILTDEDTPWTGLDEWWAAATEKYRGTAAVQATSDEQKRGPARSPPDDDGW